jgi:PAS domain S-box-containing protein
MSSELSLSSSVPSGDDDDVDEQPRVLLFMSPGRDRELLVDTLGRQYAVKTTTDIETLEKEFDCCVFDSSEFQRVVGTVQSKRDTSEPVFLPFVLLTEGEIDRSDVEVWEYVDDVIEMPVKKAALLSRIENLVKRRRTAARLAEREEQLEETVANLKLKERAMNEAPVGITITDPDRKHNPIIYSNRQFETITGYGPEAIGENHRLLQGPETDPETKATLREAISAEEPISVDILNYRKDGRKFWNRLSIAPIRKDGRVSNYVGFQTAITERKIRERRLEVLNRVLSHNLRNKMNVIEGHASLLRDVYDGDRALSSLSEIENAATDLMGLAETTQDVDRALSGAGGDAEVDLPERIEQLISASEDQFPSATFSLSSPEEPCRVAVPGLITAIGEAVENAVAHNSSDEPVVNVRIENRSDGWTDIEIEDNGPGIPDQELEVLRTGETSLNHADRLGLWFIYWVVSRIGGEFSITDADPQGVLLGLSIPPQID